MNRRSRLGARVTPHVGSWHEADIKPRPLLGRYGWKADFEQAASVIVLCARQGVLAQFRANKPETTA
jgi:hypothetical protein